MTYLIAQISGKQFVIKPNKLIDINYFKKGNIGDYIILNKILFIKKENKFQVGKPLLKKCEIYAKIIQHLTNKKIKVLKTKEKKNYTRTKGHKQKMTRILT